MITLGSTPGESSSQGWLATDYHGTSSAVQLQGSVLEMAGKAKRRSLQSLIDSGAARNIILDRVVAHYRLAVGDDGTTILLQTVDE